MKPLGGTQGMQKLECGLRDVNADAMDLNGNATDVLWPFLETDAGTVDLEADGWMDGWMDG